MPVDCERADRRSAAANARVARGPRGDARHRPTLLLENLERLPRSRTSRSLSTAIRQNAIAARIIATAWHTDAKRETRDESDASHRAEPLWPCPARCASRRSRSTCRGSPTGWKICRSWPSAFWKRAIGTSSKQVGSVRPEALDLLALYSWPGELDELREVIAAAHRAATTHEITPADLPPIVHHASNAAAHGSPAAGADRARRAAGHDRKGSHRAGAGPSGRQQERSGRRCWA